MIVAEEKEASHLNKRGTNQRNINNAEFLDHRDSYYC